LLAYFSVHYIFVYGHAYAYAPNEYIWKLANSFMCKNPENYQKKSQQIIKQPIMFLCASICFTFHTAKTHFPYNMATEIAEDKNGVVVTPIYSRRAALIRSKSWREMKEFLPIQLSTLQLSILFSLFTFLHDKRQVFLLITVCYHYHYTGICCNLGDAIVKLLFQGHSYA